MEEKSANTARKTTSLVLLLLFALCVECVYLSHFIKYPAVAAKIGGTISK